MRTLAVMAAVLLAATPAHAEKDPRPKERESGLKYGFAMLALDVSAWWLVGNFRDAWTDRFIPYAENRNNVALGVAGLGLFAATPFIVHCARGACLDAAVSLVAMRGMLPGMFIALPAYAISDENPNVGKGAYAITLLAAQVGDAIWAFVNPPSIDDDQDRQARVFVVPSNGGAIAGFGGRF